MTSLSVFPDVGVRRGIPRLLIALGILLAVAIGSASAPVAAQQAQPSMMMAHRTQMSGDNAVWGANWQLAARFAPYKLSTLTKSTSVNPNWIKRGDRFWYQFETTDGTFYYIVDPVRGTRRQIFDNDRIASEITRITKDPWDRQHLGIRNIRFLDDNTMQFEVQSSEDEKIPPDSVKEEQQEQERRGPPPRPQTRKKVYHFEYTVATQSLRLLEPYQAPDNHPGWAGVSPDSSVVVFNRKCNLYSMTWAEYQKVLNARRGKTGAQADSADMKVTTEETQLTTDGEMYYCYGSYGRGQNDEETQKNWGQRQSAGIIWSHDSRYFAFTREDARKVNDLWVVHVIGNKRPQLETYKYAMPGEKEVGVTELQVYDMQSKSMKKIDDKPWKDQRMGLFADPRGGGGFFGFGGGGGAGREEPNIAKWLSNQSNELYFWRRSRDQHRVDVLVADPATGAVKTVIEERLNTYVENLSPRRLANGDLIWWSERDGWAHLYKYGPDGTMKARLTEGPWHVSQIIGLDERTGFVYFTANAREAGEDPYYYHQYRVSVNGGPVTLINSGDFNHNAAMSESGRYFVDNYSRVNTVPTSALYESATGRKIMDLETADFSLLENAGYEFPETFKVESADGVTDIYGVMYKPFDFDPAKKYPIVAYVYPGPQTESVSKSWSASGPETALAQMGFVVITIGNRGGHPDRSKWYHNYGYGNLRDYGLADKKAGIEQLADRFDYIDISRVGIYGHSGGGFMSTAAMLVYPDFFKVAVSSSGNHNNDVYNLNWSEKHDGVKEVVSDSGAVTFEYDIQKNSDLAKNLKGHLMLVTGDVDNNVHHAGTFRVADALVKANKRFDFFLFPESRHGFTPQDYWFWLRAEYFAKWLLGDERTAVDIAELNNEKEQTAGGAAARAPGGGN
jgi:dipeptidyl aminopeptidase/acylaminoacyl peptidase